MLLSTTTSVINRKIGDEAAIKLIAKAGFDAYDMSFVPMGRDDSHPLNGENYMEYIKQLRRVADEAGIVCNQAHAPFHSSYGDPETDEKRYRQIVRSIECAAALGAKIIIVHPKQHLNYSENAELLREMNIEFYRSLIPYCKKYGIKAAVENMWQQEGDRIVDSTCASPEEFCDYIDSIGSEYIVACLDVGHTPIVRRPISEMITLLGNRLCALHIHDNDLVHDNHTLPFLMKMDFISITKALKEIDYKGDFTFEVESYFSKMPNELLLSAARLMHDVGRYLIKEIKSC